MKETSNIPVLEADLAFVDEEAFEAAFVRGMVCFVLSDA